VDGGLHRIEYGATTVGTPEVRYTYDRAGRRISTRQFNGSTELRRVDWQPDETGAFGTETLVESGATTFTLTRGADSVLRPGSLTLQRTATNVLAMTYGYDAASRLTSVSDGTLSATYVYQANSDLLSTITLRNGATTRLTTTRVYDRWGRLQSQWAVANAASVQPAVGSGYTYNTAGQRIRQDLGDGTYWTYAYDTLGQLTGAQHRWPDGNLVAGQQYGYLYDDIGNRKQSLEGGYANGAGLQTTTYTANLLNQYSGITTPGVVSVNGLANATNAVTVNGAATVRQGEYWWRETSVNNASAPVWASLNVAASNGGTTNTTVNRYVPKASETPTYDDDGNQTGDGRWIYRWDAENRLVEMETTSIATTAGVPYAKVRWTYDPLGRRIQRETWQGASPVVVTKYVYDGWQCLSELDGSNAVTATYAWGLDLSGSLTGAGGVGGLLWVNHTQHGRQFYSYDGNGNACGLTSATDGTRTGGYEYDPFGGVIRASELHPVAGWNEWRFSTKRQDARAGLLSYENRDYCVESGRWLNRDRLLSKSVAGNPVLMVGNNAVDAVDLLGLYQVDGHYYYVISALVMLGYPPDRSLEIAFYSQLPDELMDTTAFDFSQMPYFFEKVVGRDPVLKELGDYIHSLGMVDLDDILARRACLCRLLRGDEGGVKPWQAGFLMHALGDAHSHTWSRMDDPFGHRGQPSITAASSTVGYPSFTGHAGAGTWPDIIGNRPSLYAGFLDYLEGCIPRSGPGPNDMSSLRRHILATSPLLSSKGRVDRARSFAEELVGGGALDDYRPEDIDAFWLKDVGKIQKRLPFALPSVGEIKQWISWVKCSCGGK